ncbi:hypothetical protein JX266_013138 [Neoarthrinium moseri]|nr:hypothetical protein JX266_013138 [Neoarthrinium moseri]
MGLRSFKERMLSKMAESKAKSNVNGAAKPAKEPSKFMNWLNLTKSITTDTEQFKEYAEIVEARGRLQKQYDDLLKEHEQLKREHTKMNQELTNEKANAKKERAVLTHSFGERYQAWKQNDGIVEKCNEEIAKLQTDRQSAKSENQKLQSWVKQLEAKCANANNLNAEYERTIRDLQNEHTLLRGTLQTREAQRDKLDTLLKQAEDNLGLGFLRSLDKASVTYLRSILEDLSGKCQQLTLDFFSSDYVPKNLKAVIESENGLKGGTVIPLSVSTSKEGKLMRCAAAGAVIANTLQKHVFRLCYVPSDVGQAGPIIEAAERLLELFDLEKERQDIYRCQLLQLLDDTKVCEEVAERATSEAYSVLGQLVPNSRLDDLQSELIGLFREAVEMWSSRAQLARDVVVAKQASREDAEVGWYKDVYGSISEPNYEHRSICAHLFPRIVAVSEGAVQVLHGGCVLWSNQPAVLMAKDEAASAQATASNGGGLGRAKRRSSVNTPRSPVAQRAQLQ